LGAVLQMVSPHAVAQMRSHRRWVVLCASCQTLALAVMPAACLLGDAAGWFLMVTATIYWGASLATGPAWNTWIEAIVPRKIRHRFFAERARLTQACVLLGFVVAGLALQSGTYFAQPLMAFTLLFLTAAACRLVSTICLAKQSETALQPEDHVHIGLRQWTTGLRADAGGKLLVYLLTMQVCVQISGPYFTPYMLGQLELSYLHYMLLIGVAYLGKIMALPILGRFAHRFGARRLLWVGGLGIVPIAGLWLVSQWFPYLLFVQLLSGTFWAAYELAMILMFFESIPKSQRTSVLTIYNLGNALALVGGALIGATFLKYLDSGPTAYLTLFGLSSLARAATLVLLRRVPDRAASPVPPATRTIAIRPSSADDVRPILSTLSQPEEEKLDEPLEGPIAEAA